VVGLALAAASVAQTSSETVATAPRQFSSEAMGSYLSDDAFAYIHLSPKGMSLWDQFWFWVFSQFASLFGGPNGDTITNFLWWAFIGVVIVGAAVLLVSMRYGSVFSPHNSGASNPGYFGSSTRQTNYDQLLKEALDAGDIRLAIRYLYLKGLMALDNRKLIKMRSWKTGADYVQELSGEGRSAPRSAFVRLKQVFDYTWYGEFEPDASDLQLCREIVDELQKAKP